MIDIGTRRELFVDDYLIDSMKGASLQLQPPCPRETAIRFNRPWEGAFSFYSTVIKDGDLYRLYYRGWPDAADSSGGCYCYAESRDGRRFVRPDLGLFGFRGSRKNNIIFSEGYVTHSFAPFLDTHPGIPRGERLKALGLGRAPGAREDHLVGYVSADGIRWTPIRDEPVIRNDTSHFAFDSQNVAFWSEAEGCYVAYFRTWTEKPRGRRISRATSPDFLHWSRSAVMEYRQLGKPAEFEEMYVNQTHPYFRAPHIYVAFPARFMPGKRVITEAEAKAIRVVPKYGGDCADTVFMTTRGGAVYDRTFMEGFVRPGCCPEDWVSRTNYAAENVVQTGETEMSLYVNHNYAQPTAYLRRYALRLDGFSSIRAPHRGGELRTKPFRFDGRRLLLNFATSAAGSIRVEVQDGTGRPLPGFALKEAPALAGNRIDHPYAWPSADIARLARRAIRLRFVMKDADLFALRFDPEDTAKR